MDFMLTKEPHGQQGSQCIRVINTGSTNAFVRLSVPTGNSALISRETGGQLETACPPHGTPFGLTPSSSLYIFPGHWSGANNDPDPWRDVTNIVGEIVKKDNTWYQATFSRSSNDQPVNPTQVIVDIRVSEGGGRGHGE